MQEQILLALANGGFFLGSLPEAEAFDRSALSIPETVNELCLNQKLGHLYEDGLQMLLEHSERYEVLEKGLQIQKDRTQTLGELDYLYRDLESGELVHLELAVKFYMAIESPSGLLLPGPNSRDNYYNKLERLRSHQLTLTKNYREYLPARYQLEEIVVKQLTIGCLFDHIDAKQRAQPPYLNSAARRGLWMRQSEFLERYSNHEAPLLIPKPLWLVEIQDISEEQLTPLNLFTPLSRCAMVKILGLDQPVFLTPDEYPKQ